MVCAYGNDLAFGWRGSSEFNELAENMVVNYGFTGGRIHKLNEQIKYILISEDKLRAKIAEFLQSCANLRERARVWNEETGEAEYGPEVDVAQRVARFMTEFVRHDAFLRDTSGYDTYSIGWNGRDEE